MLSSRFHALWFVAALACSGSDDEPATTADTNLPSLQAPEDVAAPPANAERSASGLAWRVLVEGTGTESPTEESRVRVHYSGWHTDGERFDSSVADGSPAEFDVDGVIRGWTEALQLMVEGEQRRLWIPEELAYQGRPNRPQGMLVFDVLLIEIVE